MLVIIANLIFTFEPVKDIFSKKNMGRKISIKDLLEKSNLHVKRITLEVGILNYELLTTRTSPESWTVTQTIQHLNNTFDHYFPKIEEKIHLAPKSSNESGMYKASILVGAFSNSQRPKNGKRKFKIKTFSFLVPDNELDPAEVIARFVSNHREFDKYIEKGLTRDISKVKVDSAVGALLKFRLPECFDFLLNHEERHLRQIDEILENVEETKART